MNNETIRLFGIFGPCFCFIVQAFLIQCYCLPSKQERLKIMFSIAFYEFTYIWALTKVFHFYSVASLNAFELIVWCVIEWWWFCVVYMKRDIGNWILWATAIFCTSVALNRKRKLKSKNFILKTLELIYASIRLPLYLLRHCRNIMYVFC